MKTLILLLLSGSLAAQTIVDKTVPATKGQHVKISFDYPDVVRVSTWDKNEVSVHATVSINGGDHDEAFQLDAVNSGSTIEIRNVLNIENIPHRYTLKAGGKKVVFTSKDEWKKYRDENGLKDYSLSEGVDMDILIEVKVPAGTETSVHSTYGMVEVNGFNGPLVVEATYGGVDMLVNSGGQIEAETRYGHIYSDPAIPFKTDTFGNEDFHTSVTASLGTGPHFHLESPYGNVYVRKKPYEGKGLH